MPHISRSSRRYLSLLFVAILAAALLHYFYFLTRMRNLAASLYLLILLVWLVSAGRRLLLPRIRRFYMLGAALLILLFLLRMIHYQTGLSALNRYCWYAYYLSFSALPLCFLSSAYLIGREENSRFPFWLTGAWIGWGCLSLLALTNDLHGLLFEIEGLSAGAYQYSYRPLYFCVVAWIAVGMLTGFALLLHRCRVRQCRALWYVPVLAAVPGVALLAWFYLNGGSSPSLFGHSLYNVQEAYMILFLFVWESCIQIGLVPSNTDYETIFALLPLDAFITGEAGQVLLRSADAVIPPAELLDAVRLTPQELDADHILYSHPIRGGAVYWSKDIGACQPPGEHGLLRAARGRHQKGYGQGHDGESGVHPDGQGSDAEGRNFRPSEQSSDENVQYDRHRQARRERGSGHLRRMGCPGMDSTGGRGAVRPGSDDPDAVLHRKASRKNEQKRTGGQDR